MAKMNHSQLADSLKSNIINGTYSPGEKIPTEPELSKLFSATRYAVRQAVAQLEKEGFLQRIQGSGTYVTKSLPQLPAEREVSSPSDTIGLIMMDDRNYIFSEVMRGASDYLTSQGYLMNFFMTDTNYDSEKRALDMLLKSRPAGVLLEPINSGLLSVNYDLYQQLASQVPCLLLHSPDIGICPSLSLHDREGAKMLTEYLIGLGHSRIGTLFCFEESTAQKRYCGFLEALREHGFTQEKDAAVWTLRSRVNDFFEPAGALALDRMLQRVTAIFCHDDRVAYALIRHLEQKGIRVPQDISVVGYDDSFYATLGLPITSVTHPKAQYGINAAQALLEMIHSSGPIDLSRFTVMPELVIRSSAAAPAVPESSTTETVTNR